MSSVVSEKNTMIGTLYNSIRALQMRVQKKKKVKSGLLSAQEVPWHSGALNAFDANIKWNSSLSYSWE